MCKHKKIVDYTKYNHVALFCLQLKENIDYINQCFDKAYEDCGKGYRFEEDFFNQKEDIKKFFMDSFEKKYKHKFSIDLIEEIANKFKFNKTDRTSFGAAQKVVNMFFKYLFLCEDFTKIKITNVKKLHCPLDSVILSYVEEYKDKKWTKIKDRDEYLKIQSEIETLIRKAPKQSELALLSRKCGNLAFDFIYWPKGKKTE